VTVLALLLLEARVTLEHIPGVTRDTVFGRVHFGRSLEADGVDTLRAALQAAGTTDVFVYPTVRICTC
jgi:hypothetical protein